MIAALAACFLGLPGRARADVFNYLSAPVDVTPGSTSAWVDVNVSANVPAGATGVILQMLNTSGSSTYHYGVRNNGSTDGWMVGTQATALAGSTSLFMVGVDGSRIFECYIQNTAVKTYLLGYTTAGATFFTNAVDKSTTTTGSYVDIDISGDTGANTAIGAIFIIKNTSGTAKTFNLRKNGSSDDRYTSVMAGWATMALIGVDGSELCEQKIFDTTMDAYLVGYITSGAVLFTNAVAKTTGTTGSYVDTDITGDIAADDATGAILEFTASSGYATAVRKNGASYDYYGYIQHGWGICAIDNGDIFEQKIGNSNMDLYLVGYTLHTTTVYRSVGTNTGTLYSTGNCSISAGASTVTFAGGASLPSNVGAGDRLTIGGSTVYYILSRDSATQVTVQETADAASSGAAYTITRAYNDFQTWETARDGNLVTGERSEVAVAYDDGDFTTATTINGSTTSASYYMSITVASGQGHSGVAGAGVLIDMNNASSAITVSDDYVRITGLQFRRCAGAAGRFAVRLNNGNNALLEQLIIYDFDTDTTCRGIRNSTATGTIVRNCIIYGGEGYGIHADTGSVSLTVQNCTVYGMTGTGILQGAGTLTATNCVSVGNSTADLGGTITQSYNVSSDASASGAGSLSGKYAGNQFVSITAGSEDLHLKSGADAVNAGSDLSASFSGDVDGVNRPAGSAWDIGADERSAGSTDANYRSVGTNAGTIYGTGTCSISAGATTATFASATLPANVGPGDKLTVGSHVFYLLSRDSATQATVQVAASAAITNQAYTITRAYNDFATWESDRDGDLVTDNRQETAVGYDDGDFTPGATITIDGSTTDATRYMMITVASGQRHEGVAGTGVLIDLADAASAIAASDDYTRIEWLQLYQFSGAATRAGVVVAASNVLVENVLASDFSAGTPSNGILCNSGTVTVRNCIVYTGGIGLATNGGTMTAQNCTVGDMLSYGVRNASGTLTATNVISAVGATACFSGTITQSYNLSTDATATGTGSLTSVDVNDLFVSIIPGSIDLHLKGGSDGIDAGTDLSASFTGDIDEETRPVAAAWDMGADERSVTVTNYRSVGTDAATLYSTGTASISSGTSTATFGGGASLPANVGQGDKLTIGGTDFYVLSRDSATQATVQETASSTLTDEAYTIVRAYNDLQSWETARQGNLVADGRVEVAVAWDDGDFTSALTIDGSTTSAMNYMAITVPSGQRHNGQSGAGAVLDMSNTATGITVSDDYVRISWLQVRRTGGASLRSGVMVSNAAGVVLDGLLIYDFNGAAGIYGVCAAPNGSATVRNCVVYDGTGSGLITAAASSTLTVESCTVYGITGRGVYESAGTITATNTIAMDCSTEDFSSGVTQSYNMSSDASASGAGSLPGRTASDELVYVLAGNWNLHLKPGSDAVDAGSDLSASFTTDVDHGTRAAPWDIGADEHGVSGAGQKLTPRIASWREAAP